MDKTIFREKSVEKVSSPEELDQYLKVTSPGVWMTLLAIIVVLVGAIIWGVVGRIETTIPTGCSVADNTVTCYIKEEDFAKVKVNQEIELDGVNQRTTINSITGVGYATAENSNDLMRLINVKIGEYIYQVEATIDAKDGIYSGFIVVESVRPSEFIW